MQAAQPAAAALELLIEGAQTLMQRLRLLSVDRRRDLTGGAWPDLVVEVATV